MWAVAAWVALSAVAAPAEADHAAIQEAFNRHVVPAMKAKEEGRFEEALTGIDRALDAIREVSGGDYDTARARLLFHRSMVLIELQRYREALAALEIASAAPGLTDDNRRVVVERLGFVKGKLDELRVRASRASLTLRVRDPGGAALEAAVSVDGVEEGRAPLSLERDAGTYRVRVSHPGYLPWDQELALEPGAQVDRTVLLEAVALPGAAPGPPAGAIVTGAVGLAALVAGVVLHQLAASDFDDAEREGIHIDEARQSRSDGVTKRDLSYALMGVGGLGLAVGATWWALAPTSDEAGVQVSVRVGF